MAGNTGSVGGLVLSVSLSVLLACCNNDLQTVNDYHFVCSSTFIRTQRQFCIMPLCHISTRASTTCKVCCHSLRYDTSMYTFGKDILNILGGSGRGEREMGEWEGRTRDVGGEGRTRDVGAEGRTRDWEWEGRMRDRGVGAEGRARGGGEQEMGEWEGRMRSGVGEENERWGVGGENESERWERRTRDGGVGGDWRTRDGERRREQE